MKMKSHIRNLLIAVLGITFLMTGNSLSYAAGNAPMRVSGAQASCLKEKAEFRKLYVELQKSLNYEGKDAYVDARGNVQLKPHAAGKDYEGKVFEEALFKEYQNSLRKVALMYQASKFDAAAPAEFKSNSVLVDFIKAIDGNDGAKYISANNVNLVIDGLQKASHSKYPGDSKFRINDNDRYLLKKLLTHAQDRICSIEKYQETGKSDRNFSAEELEKKKNAPLNQLILAIKDAKITKDSDIKLEAMVDEKTAINSAIAANINALSAWAKKNAACLKAVRADTSAAQSGIQACNYRKFIDTLSSENMNNVEAILHFINSNEKFKHNNAKAETAMDEMKMQAFVDGTFSNLDNKINCSVILAPKNRGTRLFVRNLPYNNATGKFDTTKLECKVQVKTGKVVSEKTLTDKECSLKFELVSDELGRGLEVRQKNQAGTPISFSVKDNPSCKDIALVAPQAELVVAALKTDEICSAEGKKLIPSRDLIASEDKKSCVTKEVLKTDEICSAEGKKENPSRDLIAAEDKKSCVVKEVLKTDEICSAEGKKENPSRDLIAAEDKKSCVVKDVLKTDEICSAEGKKENPSRDLIASEDKKSCVTKEVLKTDEICSAEGKKENPSRDLIAAEDKKSCVEKKSEESPEEKICKENNKKLSDEELGRAFTDWQVKDGKCINTKDKPSKSRDTSEDEVEKPARAPEKFTAPPRFTPVNIPTRQMYILPGMP